LVQTVSPPLWHQSGGDGQGRRSVCGPYTAPLAQAPQGIRAPQAQDPLVVDRHASPRQCMRDPASAIGCRCPRRSMSCSGSGPATCQRSDVAQPRLRARHLRVTGSASATSWAVVTRSSGSQAFLNTAGAIVS
jgi:hypothetical protein